MVKAPTTRHSKSGRTAVTLDLEAQKRTEAQPNRPSEASGDDTSGKESGSPRRTPATTAGEAFSATQAPKPAAAEGLAANAQAPAKPASSSSETIGGATQGSGSASPSAAAGGSTSLGSGPASAEATSGPARSPAASTAAKRGGAGFGSLLAAAVVGGVVALGGYALLDNAGVVGSSPATSTADIDSLRAEVEALRDAAPADAGDAVAALQSEIAALASQVEALQQAEGSAAPAEPDPRIADLEQRLNALEQNPAADEDLSPRLDALEAELRAANDTGADLQREVTDLRNSIEALNRQVEASAGDNRLELALSASALKAAIDSGQDFRTELDAFAAQAPDAPEVAALRELAEGGVPSRAEIAAELPAAADAMVAAARPAPEGGIASRLWAGATSLVEVRPVGASVTGNEPPAVVARLEAAVQAGNYGRALAEYEALPEAAQRAGEDLAAKLRARQAADELVGRSLSQALSAGPASAAATPEPAPAAPPSQPSASPAPAAPAAPAAAQ